MYSQAAELTLVFIFTVASLGSLWSFARRQGSSVVLCGLCMLIGCFFLYTLEGQSLWEFKLLVTTTLATMLTTVTYLAYISAGTTSEFEQALDE